MTDEQHTEPGKEKHRVEVYWTTVTYKTVAVYLVTVFATILAVLYLIFPDHFADAGRKFRDTVGGKKDEGLAATANKARFVNLDGKVEVKKVTSVQWAAANPGTTLDKGDLIRTGGDSFARITFPDGSTYTVKSDTLITVEENMVAQDRSTTVGVHISSGAVDLATGTFEAPNSRAEVSFENARAAVRENSRVAVRSDPETKQHELTVAQGTAQVEQRTERGTERVELGRYERVSFTTGSPMVKAQVLAPPEPTRPTQYQPIMGEAGQDPKRTPVRFEWKGVTGAAAYELKVSTSSMFANVVLERRTSGTSLEVTGLAAGDYFWAVRAVDAQKRVSEPSETYKFTLAAQGKAEEMLLEISEPQVHGNLVEIVGRTEPGATLLIGGQPVGNIQPDGRFRHFTPPLARGTHQILITGQNRRGGMAFKRITIVIP